MKKITRKLILGISSIVFISTILIIAIFMAQYRNMLLTQESEELTKKADEIANFGVSIIDEDQMNQKSPVSQLINGLINSSLWIIDTNQNVILSTTSLSIATCAMDQITKDISKTQFQVGFVSYDYSDCLGAEYISTIRPIYEKEGLTHEVIGYVILHKQVSNIYENDNTLFLLILISVLISIALSIVAGIFYSFHFTKPIERMTDVAKRISEGDYKVKTNIHQDDEIGQLALTLDDMTEKLDTNINEIKRLESSAKELVANVSHEFKTPLTIIRGHIENLQEGIETNTNDTYNKILNNTKLLDRLVNELLDLNKYQNGKVELKIEQLELVQVINEVVYDMKSISNNKDINIITKIKGGDVKLLEADYIKFKQLITIILDNAIKFSPNKSKIEIYIEDDKVIIKDHGKGIKPEDLDHIFERFYRSDENNDGYGLGLCIAKYIADKHGFGIEMSSKINKGTQVTILL